MHCLVVSEPSIALQNSSSQLLVRGDGLSVFLGRCHISNLPSSSCQALPRFPLFPGLRLEVDFFAVEGRFQQSWAEQMFRGVVGVNMLTLGKDRTGLQGVNRALLLQPSVFHQKFLER